MAKKEPKFSKGQQVRLNLADEDPLYKRFHGKIFTIQQVAVTSQIDDYYIELPRLGRQGFGEEELEEVT
jgi:hypothetical protein